MNYTLQRFKYIFVDTLSALIVWTVFYVFRRIKLDGIEVDMNVFSLTFDAKLAFIFVPVLWLAIYSISGYYNRENLFFKSRLHELAVTLISVFVGSIIIFFSVFLDDPVVSYVQHYKFIAFFFFLQFVFTYAFRYLLTYFCFNKIRRGNIFYRTIILGNDKIANNIENKILNSKDNFMYKVLGYVCINAHQCSLKGRSLGMIDEIEDILASHKADVLVIADKSFDRDRSYELINKINCENLLVYRTPDKNELLTGAVKTSTVYGLHLIGLTSVQITSFQSNFKRCIDVIGSILALILTSPVLLYFYLRIGKHPIYSQQRIGLKNKSFTIYKFRTMVLDAEKGVPMLSSENDSRVTSLGKMMRKYRIDELPQLYNVLKGDMSLVGPRPERAYYLEKIYKQAPYYRALLNLKPGLTSWGIVNFGYASDVKGMLERANYDILYYENQSILLDFKILIYTIKTIFYGEGK